MVSTQKLVLIKIKCWHVLYCFLAMDLDIFLILVNGTWLRMAVCHPKVSEALNISACPLASLLSPWEEFPLGSCCSLAWAQRTPLELTRDQTAMRCYTQPAGSKIWSRTPGKPGRGQMILTKVRNECLQSYALRSVVVCYAPIAAPW